MACFQTSHWIFASCILYMWFDANDLGIFIFLELISIFLSSLRVLGFVRAVAVSCNSEQRQFSPNSFTVECEIFCCRHL